MELKLKDRFILVQLMPQVGSLKDVKLSKVLTEKLLPTEKEVEEYKITQNEGVISWSQEGDTPIFFEMSEDEIALIKKQFIKLDQDSQIDTSHEEIIDRLFDGNL